MIAICTEHVAVGSGVLQPPLSNASVKRQAINGDVCVCVCSVMHSNMHISRSYSFCLNHRSRDVIHVPPVCRQTSIRLILLFLSYHTFFIHFPLHMHKLYTLLWLELDASFILPSPSTIHHRYRHCPSHSDSGIFTHHPSHFLFSLPVNQYNV